MCSNQYSWPLQTDPLLGLVEVGQDALRGRILVRIVSYSGAWDGTVACQNKKQRKNKKEQKRKTKKDVTKECGQKKVETRAQGLLSHTNGQTMVEKRAQGFLSQQNGRDVKTKGAQEFLGQPKEKTVVRPKKTLC